MVATGSDLFCQLMHTLGGIAVSFFKDEQNTLFHMSLVYGNEVMSSSW